MLLFQIFVSKLTTMEIKEIVSYFLNVETNTLEVSFRAVNDDDDVLRTDNIDYSITEEYGFVLESEDFHFYGEELDEEDEEFEDEPIVELDEDVLISFLNEYYEINPTLIPKPEFY